MTYDLREWLQPDGLGGYAMGTAAGIRTRGYHALLCTATQPPGGRRVLVNGLEAFVESADGRRLALSSHAYRGGVIHPDGAGRISRFRWEPWPRWEFLLEDGARIVQEIVVTRAMARVVLRWRHDGGAAPRRLWVRPLLSGRDFHAMHRQNPHFRFTADRLGDCIVWRPYAGVPAITASATGEYRHEPDWYRSFEYAEEAARGLACEEDLAAPGVFAFDLSAGPAVLALSAGEPDPHACRQRDLAAFAEESFTAGGVRPVPPGSGSDAATARLRRAVDAYLVQGGAGQTIIAGYPWFGAWGRDTFVSLRGLCLATGRLDDARRILLCWAKVLSDGMLPNRFVETGGVPEYHSVDASLWFVVAADAFLAKRGVCTALERRELEQAVGDIVASYAAGTRLGIGAADDGLLRCGERDTQLTWMDARVDRHAITPRVGKPVEVQALWINALTAAARRERRWIELLSRAQAAFAARFWNPTRRMLYDVVDVDHEPGRVDERFRPNQIFAVGGGLPVTLIEGERARAVVDAVERVLWTPAGLRSLAPNEPGYAGRYRGGPAERDAHYHQGTVWTWLTGPFAEAWVRVRGDDRAARAEARRRFLEPLNARLELGGLGHLAEIADGDPPHAPRGCPFQAWSVAEALRLDLEVLDGAAASPPCSATDGRGAACETSRTRTRR